jgi:hypothetical protein
MADNKTVKWFDLQRFHAALKVVPNSPLRGTTLTCLEVSDQAAFTLLVHRDIAIADEYAKLEDKAQLWRENLTALGFSTRPEFFERADSPEARCFRLYSERTTFTLSEMQTIVPGVTADDYGLMPLSRIVSVADVLPEMAEEWKRFAESGLANEAVEVWTTKVNPFDKPYAQARTMSQVWDDYGKRGGRFKGIDSDPTTNWFAGVLERGLYRENSLTSYYPDREYALAAGHAPDDLQQVTLPYALPLFVERTGRIVAFKDVRYAPEVLAQRPRTVVGRSADTGESLAVKPLLAVRDVAVIYREEAAKWDQWHASSDPVDTAALAASMRRVVEADRNLCVQFDCFYEDRLSNVLDSNYARIVGPQPVKSLSDWTDQEYRLVAGRAMRYLSTERDGDAATLREGEGKMLLKFVQQLHGLDARSRAQDAARAREVAQDALRRVAERVQDAPEPDAADKVRHEDAGEKIGGARKDYHRRAMTTDDLEGMNDFERKSLVVKKNVWPPLDYEAMRDAGVEPKAAVAIKYFKDSIAVSPDRKHSASDNPEVDYIDALRTAREAMQDVKTLEQFAQACFDLHKVGAGETNYIYGGSAMQVQLGNDTCHLLHDASATYGYGANERTEPYVPRKVQREVRKRVREDAEWDWLIKPKREKTDAEKDADSERGEKERELHRPHLDKVERTGGEDFRAGRDVVGQDLMDHFGFRALEFGNWLDQGERQAVLNMAFDSLCDLAAALDIPPKGISLGGKLAVAFGSRGRGGKNAALAHFEPGRFVINLTRMKGAGTLAHEWFHALDCSFGDMEHFATARPVPRFDNDPLRPLVAAMFKRLSTPDEVIAKFKTEAEKGRDWAASWTYEQGADGRKKVTEVLSACFERAHALLFEDATNKLTKRSAEEAASGKKTGVHPLGISDFDTRLKLRDQIMQAVSDACHDRKAFNKRKAKIEPNVGHMVDNAACWMTAEAAREIGYDLGERFYGGENLVETDFLKAAKSLDDKRSSPYWATDIELFARAGAQYVHYELAERGIRSDYLVYGAETDRYKDHEIGNPNPPEHERVVLHKHFAAVIDDFRVRLLRTLETQACAEP